MKPNGIMMIILKKHSRCLSILMIILDINATKEIYSIEPECIIV